LEQIIGVAGHLEEQLDAEQFSCAASHNAAEEPEVGVINELSRQVIGITQRHELDRRRTFGVRPGQKPVREGAELSLTLSLRCRAAHPLTALTLEDQPPPEARPPKVSTRTDIERQPGKADRTSRKPRQPPGLGT